MTKMTKIKALNLAIDLAKNFAPDNAELSEKLNAMLASEQKRKRKNASRLPVESKAHKENVAAIGTVVQVLSGVKNATAKKIAETLNLSVQKTAAILRVAESAGAVVADRDGKVICWSLATTDEPETDAEVGE